MRRIIIFLVLVGLVTVPTVASAVLKKVKCPAEHFLDPMGTEIAFTCFSLQNGNVNPKRNVNWQRLTGRNLYGTVVHNSVAPNLPVNTGVDDPDPVTNPNGLNISPVPGGATYFICTTHIWGLASIPNTGLDPGGNLQGTGMVFTIEYTHLNEAPARNVTVVARRRVRQLLPGPGPPGPVVVQGDELSANLHRCVPGRREP